jgi:hypothetical protein
MNRYFYLVTIARCLAICLLINAASALAPIRVLSSGSNAAPLSTDEIVRAHGSPQALASAKTAEFEIVRITPTLGPFFFDHRMIISIRDSMFRRYTVDAEGSNKRVEVFDGHNAFCGSQNESGDQQWLPMEERRLHVVRFIVATCLLLPFLQQLASQTADAIFQEVTRSGLCKFTVKTQNWKGALYADRTGLIKQIEIGDRIFQFAAYSTVEGLRLPSVVRVFWKRVVFEMFFSRISINPVFSPDRFAPEMNDEE